MVKADETYHTPLDVLVGRLDHPDTPLTGHSRLAVDPRPRKPLRYVQYFQNDVKASRASSVTEGAHKTGMP